MPPTRHHRLPRAGVDPLCSDGIALATVLAAVRLPLRAETIALLLDDARRGLAVVAVAGTERPGDVVHVAERLLDPVAHDGLIGAAVLATVRPGGQGRLADADIWLELDDLASANGIELLEWFVLGQEVERPRELLNAPPRW